MIASQFKSTWMLYVLLVENQLRFFWVIYLWRYMPLLLHNNRHWYLHCSSVVFFVVNYHLPNETPKILPHTISFNPYTNSIRQKHIIFLWYDWGHRGQDVQNTSWSFTSCVRLNKLCLSLFVFRTIVFTTPSEMCMNVLHQTCHHTG